MIIDYKQKLEGDMEPELWLLAPQRDGTSLETHITSTGHHANVSNKKKREQTT